MSKICRESVKVVKRTVKKFHKMSTIARNFRNIEEIVRYVCRRFRKCQKINRRCRKC